MTTWHPHLCKPCLAQRLASGSAYRTTTLGRVTRVVDHSQEASEATAVGAHTQRVSNLKNLLRVRDLTVALPGRGSAEKTYSIDMVCSIRFHLPFDLNRRLEAGGKPPDGSRVGDDPVLEREHLEHYPNLQRGGPLDLDSEFIGTLSGASGWVLEIKDRDSDVRARLLKDQESRTASRDDLVRRLVGVRAGDERLGVSVRCRFECANKQRRKGSKFSVPIDHEAEPHGASVNRDCVEDESRIEQVEQLELARFPQGSRHGLQIGQRANLRGATLTADHHDLLRFELVNKRGGV